MGRLDGRCLCGAITYTCDTDDPIMTGICHCTECRRQSGSAWSIIAGVSLSDLHISGTPKVFNTVGDDRGVPAHRHFCGDCGSPIISVLGDADDGAWIKAGTLDDPSWLEPELEAWTESSLPWARGPERDTAATSRAASTPTR